MNDFKVRQGSRVPLHVTQGDPEAESATLIMRNVDTDELLEITGVYEEVDGEMVADVSLTAVETAIVAVYEYQINENITGQDPLKYPDPNNCTDDDCAYPTITVCEALDEETS